MPRLDAEWLAEHTGPLIGLAAAVAIVAVAHYAVTLFVRSMIRRSGREDWAFAARVVRWPSFWIIVMLAASAALRSLPFPAEALAIWGTAAGFVFPALVGWLAIALLRAFAYFVELRNDMSVEDNLAARRRATRMSILVRVAAFVILFITVAMMLLSIPSIRSVGITLMASAGLAGLAVGAAAQPALKNLIAGIQMAFTEPIRIDDVVIVDGEWGKIEEIRLTYVVVAIWDERRLVVPISRFLESPFENWTRKTSRILGTVFLHLDPTADVARIRARLEELLPQNPRWDKRVGIVQVTEMTADAMEVRLLVSAGDAARAFDLRCDVREALLAFIRDEMPEALPRRREIVSGRLEGLAAWDADRDREDARAERAN